jgi:hypothetical protein
MITPRSSSEAPLRLVPYARHSPQVVSASGTAAGTSIRRRLDHCALVRISWTTSLFASA